MHFFSESSCSDCDGETTLNSSYGAGLYNASYNLASRLQMLHKLCRLSFSVDNSELHPKSIISLAVSRDIKSVHQMPNCYLPLFKDLHTNPYVFLVRLTPAHLR